MIRIERKITVSAAPEAVWSVLIDPFEVAACLPGAAVTERRDDGSYAGHIRVKVGPLTVTYRGVICFERLDPARFEVELVGRGQDTKGKGAAEMRMTSQLVRLEGGRTEVIVQSDIGIKGILAQFGRGMIKSVSGRIFQQFGAALEQRLKEGQNAGAAPRPAKG